MTLPVVLDALSWICLVTGSLFCIIGAAGLLRMPDFYTRTHAAVHADQVPAQSMSGGQSPSPAGQGGADGQAAPWPPRQSTFWMSRCGWLAVPMCSPSPVRPIKYFPSSGGKQRRRPKRATHTM